MAANISIRVASSERSSLLPIPPPADHQLHPRQPKYGTEGFKLNPNYAKGFQLSKQVKNKHSKPRRSWIWQHGVLVEDKHKEKYWICCRCEYIYVYINSFTLTIQQVTILEPNL